MPRVEHSVRRVGRPRCPERRAVFRTEATCRQREERLRARQLAHSASLATDMCSTRCSRSRSGQASSRAEEAAARTSLRLVTASPTRLVASALTSVAGLMPNHPRPGVCGRHRKRHNLDISLLPLRKEGFEVPLAINRGADRSWATRLHAILSRDTGRRMVDRHGAFLGRDLRPRPRDSA